MQIVEKDINSLVPYENNPRQNEGAVQFVANSIKEFGFRVPIIVDADNVIVAGHTRLLAAKELGLETVPCVVASDLTPQQVKAFRLADNKVAEASGWDYEKLEQELADIMNPEELDELQQELEGIDMTQFGFADSGTDNLQDIFEDAPQSHHEKKPKTVCCPHCGETFEI